MSTPTLATLCFPIREQHILLGLKKRRFGAGWWNGFGGRVESGESVPEAALRELYEEAGLAALPEHLEEAARIQFFLPDGKSLEVHTYLLWQWENDPVETEEMRPQWFALDAIPYGDMWPSDQLWLPQLLSGKCLRGEVRFGAATTEVVHAAFTEAAFDGGAEAGSSLRV